jgi:hypothetical protein
MVELVNPPQVDCDIRLVDHDFRDNRRDRGRAAMTAMSRRELRADGEAAGFAGFSAGGGLHGRSYFKSIAIRPLHDSAGSVPCASLVHPIGRLRFFRAPGH